MSDHEFLSKFDVSLNHAEATAATGTTTGSTVDLAGCDDAVFQAVMGTANAGNYMYVEHGDESDLSDAANVASSKTIATNDNEVMVIEIVKPRKRYMRPYIVRGASSTHGTLLALKKKSRVQPVDYTVDEQVRGTLLVSPASGDI